MVLLKIIREDRPSKYEIYLQMVGENDFGVEVFGQVSGFLVYLNPNNHLRKANYINEEIGLMLLGIEEQAHLLVRDD